MSDYFALFGLPIQFMVDEKALQQAYFTRQREAHPDKLKSLDDTARQRALLASAEANKAYDTLKNPLLRAEYLLSLEHIHVGGEKDTVKPAAALLMESMEQREALMEAEDEGAVKALEASAIEAREESIATIHQLLDAKAWQEAAQATLRLRYLEKFLTEIRARMKLLRAKAS